MFNDFARRMLGYDPFGNAEEDNQQPGPQSVSAADMVAPGLAQDRQTVAFDQLGQMGALLFAAGQRMTPYQRAQILSQGANIMGNTPTHLFNAAQARLMGTRAQAAKEEEARQDELRKQAPALATSLGIPQELSNALTPEQIRELYIKKQMADPRDSQLMDLKLQHEQAQINALNAPKAGPSPQLVDLPGGGKGWATPGSTDVMPIGGAGKGGVDPEMAKRTEAEDKNLTYAKEAIAAHRILSDPAYSGDLTSGYKNKVNKIPTLEGSWAGEKYLTGDSQANSFVDSVVRPRSGAVVSAGEMADKKRIFTPMPGDSPDRLFQKAQGRAQHIQSLIAGANPADRPMLQKMYEDSLAELQQMAEGFKQQGASSAPSMPKVKSIRQIN